MVQLGAFLGKILGPLITTGLPRINGDSVSNKRSHSKENFSVRNNNINHFK